MGTRSQVCTSPDPQVDGRELVVGDRGRGRARSRARSRSGSRSIGRRGRRVEAAATFGVSSRGAPSPRPRRSPETATRPAPAPRRPAAASSPLRPARLRPLAPAASPSCAPHLVALLRQHRPDHHAEHPQHLEQRRQDGPHPRLPALLLASAQGAARSTYVFAADASAHVASSARCGAMASHSSRASQRRALRFVRAAPSRAASASPSAGTFPSVIFAQRPSVRASRLPRFFPRSALYRSIIAAEVEVPVLPEGDRAQQLVAEHVGPRVVAARHPAERPRDPQRVHRVAERLAHLLPVEGQKPVRVDRASAAGAPRSAGTPASTRRGSAGCPCRRGARRSRRSRTPCAPRGPGARVQ